MDICRVKYFGFIKTKTTKLFLENGRSKCEALSVISRGGVHFSAERGEGVTCHRVQGSTYK